MFYQKVIRPLLMVLPVLVLAISLGLAGMGLWKNDEIQKDMAFKGLVALTPSSTVISWALLHELDASRELSRIQNQRNRRSENNKRNA